MERWKKKHDFFFPFHKESRAEERKRKEDELSSLISSGITGCAGSRKEPAEIEKEEGESLSGGCHALWTPD